MAGLETDVARFSDLPHENDGGVGVTIPVLFAWFGYHQAVRRSFGSPDGGRGGRGRAGMRHEASKCSMSGFLFFHMFFLLFVCAVFVGVFGGFTPGLFHTRKWKGPGFHRTACCIWEGTTVQPTWTLWWINRSLTLWWIRVVPVCCVTETLQGRENCRAASFCFPNMLWYSVHRFSLRCFGDSRC